MIVRIVRKIRMSGGAPANVYEVVPVFGDYQVLHEAETIQDAVQWLQSQGYTLDARTDESDQPNQSMTISSPATSALGRSAKLKQQVFSLSCG